MDDSELRSQLERHHADSYGWAVACCSQDRELAEDVLQTAYLKILEGRARYGGEAAFKTRLFTVIRITAADEAPPLLASMVWAEQIRTGLVGKASSPALAELR